MSLQGCRCPFNGCQNPSISSNLIGYFSLLQRASKPSSPSWPCAQSAFCYFSLFKYIFLRPWLNRLDYLLTLRPEHGAADIDVRRVLMLLTLFREAGGETQDDFAAVCFSPPPPPSSCLSSSTPLSRFLATFPPSSPASLDAEQTQCSLCKITSLINANKQTTALRQPQMKANLYAINRGRSAFNLPVRPARCCCTPPPSSCRPLPLLPPPLPPPLFTRLCAPYLSPCRVAGPGSKARKTD